MLTNFNREIELANGFETNYIKILYYDLSPMKCDYHSYEYSRLCTIIEGRKQVSVDKETTFTYQPDQFILLPPHSNVHMSIDTPTKALVFELNDYLLKQVIENISLELEADINLLLEDRFFLSKISSELGKSLVKLLQIYSEIERNKEFLIDLYAQELVFYLLQIKGVQQILNFEQDHPICQSIKYIKENIRQPISIKQLAADLHMSEANYCNCFKKIIGMTPKEYITNLKMLQAKELLKILNVTEAAYELGYENISHFISLFKNKYGITPKHYKSIGNTPVIYK